VTRRAQIYAAVLEAMQAAEELEGVDGDEYHGLMMDIAREAQRRAEVYYSCADCGGSTAPGTPDPHVCQQGLQRASAKVIRRHGEWYGRGAPPHPLGYVMMTGPYTGQTFVVDPADLDVVSVGEVVTVAFTPADQFARKVRS